MKKVIIILLFVANIFAGDFEDCNETCQKEGLEDVKFHKLSCDDGIASGCYTLGIMYAKDYRIKRDYKKAEFYLKKACDDGYIKGCYSLGEMYAREGGIKKDDKKAKIYLKRACDENDSEGCHILGHVYSSNKNYEKGLNAYLKSCDLNSSRGCFHVGFIYYKDKTKVVEKDINKSIKYFLKSCKIGDDYGIISSCRYATKLYAKREKTKNNFPFTDRQIYEVTCDGGDDFGCVYLGQLEEKEGKYEKAKTLYESSANDITLGLGDFHLANLYENSKGVKKDMKKAIKLYKTSCTAGFEKACFKLGHISFYSKEIDISYREGFRYYYTGILLIVLKNYMFNPDYAIENAN